jgi:ParB family chromosome partitioning protein
MPTMGMSRSKSGNLQLDLLDASVVLEVATELESREGITTGLPWMVATARLFEDAHNPRTEIPEAELAELVDDIRQHGILQPIVVHPADADVRHQIHFGAKRWRAAQRLGLPEVPVVVRAGPTNPYAQVSENLKRHGLSPLDLARFIRGRIEAGDSNSTVAKKLGLDLTTVAHHLALLDLPPVLDAAMKTGRCSSPRTLYELGKLHAAQPQRVADLLAGPDPITREAVAQIRDATLVPAVTPCVGKERAARPDRLVQMLSRATGLCAKLDAALVRLAGLDLSALSADDLAALRQRVAQLARRIDA